MNFMIMMQNTVYLLVFFMDWNNTITITSSCKKKSDRNSNYQLKSVSIYCLQLGLSLLQKQAL